MVKKILLISILILLTNPISTPASGEGTRHITGAGKDIYFMEDKVFGTINGHPLWAIYNCGSDINGKIEIKETYYNFHFQYGRQTDSLVTGDFGPLKMALGNIRKSGEKILYQVLVDDKEYTFFIRYDRIEGEHMVNSVIEGEIGNGNLIRLTADGHLCPFATTGIIMIVVGSVLLS